MAHGEPSWWTEDRVARLRELWADESQGCSAIARAMETTKNAIVAKAHRLKLPGRLGPENMRGGKPPKVAAAAPAAVPRLVVPRPMPPRRVSPPAPVRGTASPHRSCQWIEGDPAGPASLFCEAPTRPGSSYCAAHHARCWHRSERQQAA